MGSRQNQVTSHLDGLAHFSYEYIIYKSFLKKVTPHLGEPAYLTGPAHLHILQLTSKYYCLAFQSNINFIKFKDHSPYRTTTTTALRKKKKILLLVILFDFNGQIPTYLSKACFLPVERISGNAKCQLEKVFHVHTREKKKGVFINTSQEL